MEVMKSYAAKLFQGVEERKQLISAKEHRAAALYLSCCYGLQEVEKGAKQKAKDWAELQGTRLRWLAAYVVQSVGRTCFSRTAGPHSLMDHY